MTQTTAQNTKRMFFVTGLVLAGLGIISSKWTLDLISSLLDMNLRLDGLDGVARIWVLKVIFIALGLPLLLYRYRSGTRAKILFDVSMGFVLTVVLLLFIEGLFYTLNIYRPPFRPNTSEEASETYVELDEVLGYKLKPDFQVAVTQTIESKVIYDVVYSIDDKGRRVTPAISPEDRTNFILFFGGSYTFGAGVADNETLATYVAEFAPDYMPYNYGVPGYGTQQVFAKLQSDEIVAEIDQAQGIAIYSFICAHIKRVIGTSDMQNAWGEFMPYYTLDASDRLVRNGNLVSSRPVRAVLFSGVEISQTAAYFNLTLPRINDSHIRLTARMIEEASKGFEKNFGNDDFYVLFYPPGACAPQLIPYLDEARVKYFDYSNLFPRADDRLWIPDGHPTASGHKIVAEQLAVDLGIAADQ